MPSICALRGGLQCLLNLWGIQQQHNKRSAGGVHKYAPRDKTQTSCCQASKTRRKIAWSCCNLSDLSCSVRTGFTNIKQRFYQKCKDVDSSLTDPLISVSKSKEKQTCSTNTSTAEGCWKALPGAHYRASVRKMGWTSHSNARGGILFVLKPWTDYRSG